MPKQMEISIIGNVIELRREQWKGKVARITNDSALLDEVKNILGHTKMVSILICIIAS